ncbi:hypothetical protein [Egicoccus sp. AB-alg6-2]|uniref:hypothetical protein n=1 Tax=Egicoccus sp. AB-alg6-2 TaxID=3242692 RepID=UPI00359E58BC
MRTLFRRVAPTAGLLLVLTACGTDAATEAEDVTAGGGAAAGACLEGTEDCVDADLGGGDLEDPMVDETFDLDAARRDAESLLGATEEDLEIWGDVRIERKGDEEFMLTMDLMPGRKNVQLDEDADGVYRVTHVSLELPDGETEEFSAD